MATDTKTRYVCGFCTSDNCGSCRGEYRNARPGGESAFCEHVHVKERTTMSETPSEVKEEVENAEPSVGIAINSAWVGEQTRNQALVHALEHHRRKGQSDQPAEVVKTAKVFEDYLANGTTAEAAPE